jgi:recombination protein RecA
LRVEIENKVRTELGVPLLPVDEPPAPAAKPGKAEKASKAKDVDTAPVAE